MHMLPSRLSSTLIVLAAMAVCLFTARLTAGVNPPGYPPFPKGEFKPAGLGPKEPDLDITFPGAATKRSLTKGNAVVGVLVDAEGNAKDFLVIGCTDPLFGSALLDRAKQLKYQAATFKGVPVASRYNLGYTFVPDSLTVALTPMDAARQMTDGYDPKKLAYTAVAESNIDQPLEFTGVALPRLPAGMTAPADKPVKVFVTFYIDEEGHVRAPNVESAAAPELIPGAIAAVLQWSFKPPLVKGKPALIFAGRPVRFLPRDGETK